MTLTLSSERPEIGGIRDVLEAQLSFSTGRCESTAMLRSSCGARLAASGSHPCFDGFNLLLMVC